MLSDFPTYRKTSRLTLNSFSVTVFLYALLSREVSYLTTLQVDKTYL